MRPNERGKTFGRLSAALCLCAVMLAASQTTAQGPERRIRFGGGQSSATVKGRLVNTPKVDEAWQDYVLRVRRGQTVAVRLTSPGDRAGFRLTYPNGEVAEDDEGRTGHRAWTGESPASGDCHIQVSHGAEVRVTPYTLEVSVR